MRCTGGPRPIVPVYGPGIKTPGNEQAAPDAN